MRSNLELLEMYKEEKALIIGGPEVRTGLEDFPSFGEWKSDYLADYQSTHQTVSVEEADAQFDAIVEEAENELETLVIEITDDETETEEVNDMTDEAVINNVEPTEAEMNDASPAEKPAEKPKRARKEKVQAEKGAVKRPRKKAEKSKASEARKVFNRMYPKVLEGKKARKDVIAQFIEKCGLTANGASTYYQKLKKEVG